VWAALYQQRPAPAAGGIFKRARFRYWSPLTPIATYYGVLGGRRLSLGDHVVTLDDCWRFITVDLAASTKTSSDWTVAAAWAVSLEGDLILLDRNRARLEESDHWMLVRPLREQWACDVVFVESRMFGTTLVIDATLAGVPIVELRADHDKMTRALPASARIDSGHVWFPANATWKEEWETELISFPNATYDDQVDVLAYAARAISAHWVPSPLSRPQPRQMAEDRVIQAAYSAALGDGGHTMETPYRDMQRAVW